MSILKGAITVGFITLLSRISGYARDVFVSSALGTGISGDIYVIMLRLPNLFRTLFGEGALNVSFTPLYSRILATDGINEAQKTSGIIKTILTLVLLVFCFTLYFFMPEFIKITTPGFSHNPEIFKLIVKVSRITIFYLAFISLVAFYGGILNSHSKYAAFALAPIILNIGIILAILFSPYLTISVIDTVAYAISISGVLELLWMICIAAHYKLNPSFSAVRFTPEIKVFFRKLLPGIVGSGVWQINSWVEMMIISVVPGGMSLLFYADRINQLPLALIGTALGTVMMPTLAKSYGKKDVIAIHQQQNTAIEFSLLLAIPSAAAIFVLALPIISTLFERGAFTSESSIQSAAALSIYAIALPAQIISKIFVSSFYASGDTKTPVKIAALSIAVNLAVAFILIKPLLHLGMACSSVCSAWVNISVSYFILHRRQMINITRPLLWKGMRIAGCSIFMMLIISLCLQVPISPIFSLLLCITLGSLSYIAACFITKVITIEYITKYMK